MSVEHLSLSFAAVLLSGCGGVTALLSSVSSEHDVAVTERAATEDERRCAEAGWTACLDGYEVLLSHPDARAAAQPWPDCEERMAELHEAGNLGQTPPGWPTTRTAAS